MAKNKSTISEVKGSIRDTLEVLRTTFDDEHCRIIESITSLVVETIQRGNKILLCGNGGSAADSQHVAAELMGRFKKERESYPAIALTTDTSILTALANDYSFEQVFSRQVEGVGKPGDILIGISTSGTSPNVLRAVETARRRGLKTIGFTGAGGGELGNLVDINFSVLSNDTPYIQTGHGIALHTICESAEKILSKQQ